MFGKNWIIILLFLIDYSLQKYKIKLNLFEFQ